MSGMTGTFSPEVQAQINGQSTAPIGGVQTGSSAAPSPAPASSTSVPTSTSRLVTTSSANPSGTSARSTATSSSAASPQIVATGGTGLAGLFMLIVALL